MSNRPISRCSDGRKGCHHISVSVRGIDHTPVGFSFLCQQTFYAILDHNCSLDGGERRLDGGSGCHKLGTQKAALQYLQRSLADPIHGDQRKRVLRTYEFSYADLNVLCEQRNVCRPSTSNKVVRRLSCHGFLLKSHGSEKRLARTMCLDFGA